MEFFRRLHESGRLIIFVIPVVYIYIYLLSIANLTWGFSLFFYLVTVILVVIAFNYLEKRFRMTGTMKEKNNVKNLKEKMNHWIIIVFFTFLFSSYTWNYFWRIASKAYLRTQGVYHYLMKPFSVESYPEEYANYLKALSEYEVYRRFFIITLMIWCMLLVAVLVYLIVKTYREAYGDK